VRVSAGHQQTPAYRPLKRSAVRRVQHENAVTGRKQRGLRRQECNLLGADGLDVGDLILAQSGKFFGRRIEHDTCSSRLGRVPGIGFCSLGADGLDVGDLILAQSGKFFGRRIEHDTCSYYHTRRERDIRRAGADVVAAL
jgi:hypothetical protein